MASQSVQEEGLQPHITEAAIIDREVLCELIRLHIQVLKRMPMVQLLLVFALALLLSKSLAAPALLGWAVLTVSAECLRALYAKVIIKRGDIDLRPKQVHARLIVLAAIVGATVGLSAMLFMPAVPLPDQAMLGITLFTMPTAGISVAVSSRPILAAYAFFILCPTAAAWVMVYPHQTYTVGGLTSVYWLFIVSVASDGERLLRRSVTIRRERDRAVQDLEILNAQEHAAAAKAEQLSQVRARVLAAASHDLRQPLHALSVYSAILAANPAPAALPEVARNIDRLVRVLGDLLHGLLNLSRLSAENYIPERQLFSLQRVVAEVCKEYEILAAEKQLCMIRDFRPMRLFDDALAITRITRNLLDNAIKYTDQGEVRVSVYTENTLAVLSIVDTGKGIPVEEQTKVFEEFYQLHNSGREQSKGVGLGLAIVQRLCELIGAHISVESKPEVGSCFKVSFNTQVDAVFAPQTVASATEFQPFYGKRVYVVDDEFDILESMRVLLHTWGVRVETAATPESADLLFKECGSPDLLIVDLRLRDQEQGATLAKRLQNIYGDFPVLVMTGETASVALQKTQAEGYPMLQKPTSSEVLLEAVRNAFGTQHIA